MNRTQESGAYLGGIGAMLDSTETCRSCGLVHMDGPFGIRHGDQGTCPTIILGSFPVISDAVDEVPVRSVPASQQIREFEVSRPPPPPIPIGSLPLPSRAPDLRRRSLGVSWLSLPDLGEVI